MNVFNIDPANLVKPGDANQYRLSVDPADNKLKYKKQDGTTAEVTTGGAPSQFVAGSVPNSGIQVNTVLPNTATNIGDNSFGSNTTSNGGNSHSEGIDTLSSGPNSHSEGGSTISSAEASHAEGKQTTASNVAAHAEGLSTVANGLNSHAEGQGTHASAPHSHAEGVSSTASGNQSHAEGNSDATGPSAHSEGGATLSSGDSSHSEGLLTSATADNAHAEGRQTLASALQSHAEGQNTIASASNSHAEGQSTTASGLQSHAGGKGSVASRKGEFSRSSGSLSVNGDSQYMDIDIKTQTTNAVPTTILIDQSDSLILAPNTSWSFKLQINAVQIAGAGGTVGDSASFFFAGAIKNIAGVTSIIGVVVPEAGLAQSDAGAATWVVVLTANNGASSLDITATGEALKNINWTGTIRITQNKY